MAQRFHFFLFLIVFVNLLCFSSQQELSFIYNGFNQDQTNLNLDGSAKFLQDGLLQLTNATTQQKGHAFFNQPFDFGSASSQSLSFSTHFICALVPKPGVDGGHGIAFVLSSSMDLTQADPTQYLGLFNISTNGSPSSHVLAIELDTVQSAEFDDIDKNHVGIDENSLQSVESAPASYYSDKEGKNKSLKLLSGDPIQDGVSAEAEHYYRVLTSLNFPREGSLVNAVDTRLRGKFVPGEVEMVLKLGLLCTSIIPEARPNMEQVVQYINRHQRLPEFSPNTPGIGVSTPVLMGLPSLAITSSSVTSSVSGPSASPSSANNSMFISHTIIYGDGR
ncbi:unnamed protein product [Arabidopsis thaliana]|uniref:(thale cress) hypothetical protein n=1 Tax=Arabidopsis thaliana TaxID=3702 RepID=A0A7G2EUT5_ARATH|nr:unnamed protein product [Arabidopsis thaliana]